MVSIEINSATLYYRPHSQSLYILSCFVLPLILFYRPNFSYRGIFRYKSRGSNITTYSVFKSSLSVHTFIAIVGVAYKYKHLLKSKIFHFLANPFIFYRQKIILSFALGVPVTKL